MEKKKKKNILILDNPIKDISIRFIFSFKIHIKRYLVFYLAAVYLYKRSTDQFIEETIPKKLEMHLPLKQKAPIVELLIAVKC